MKSVHLIQKNRNLPPQPVTRGSQTYESGFWHLPQEKAESLIGGNIFFHEKQKSPSFFGGVITGYRIQPDGEWKGRIIFTFEALDSHKERRLKNSEGWE